MGLEGYSIDTYIQACIAWIIRKLALELTATRLNFSRKSCFCSPQMSLQINSNAGFIASTYLAGAYQRRYGSPRRC
jgi:hypothetical protein